MPERKLRSEREIKHALIRAYGLGEDPHQGALLLPTLPRLSREQRRDPDGCHERLRAARSAPR